jgi:hypothetical protein
MVIASALNFSSPSGFWQMVNQFQNILLLIISGAYMPKKVVDYLGGMDIILFSFDFIPADNTPGIHSMVKWFDYGEPSYYFEMVGLSSKSFFVNNFFLL